MTWQDYLESKICVCNLSSDVCMPYAACRMPVCVTDSDSDYGLLW
jgi:hypothetical protein